MTSVGLSPADLSVAELVRAVRARQISVVEVVTAHLDRIRERDNDVLAWETIDEGAAMADARSQDRHRSDQPLRGVPFGVKGNIDVAGLPTTNGTRAFPARDPRTDAPVVARLRAAGAIPLGKTVTTEFALRSPARTRNPWKSDRTPGGSSSGSAAAVAAHMTPFALGTQTFGSTIRPAAFCGVAALKPTYGLLSCEGITPNSWTLDHVGLIARGVGDVALALAAAVGSDPAAFAARAPRTVGLLADCVAYAEEEAAGVVHSLAKLMREAGARVVEEQLPAELDQLRAIATQISLPELAHVHEERLGSDPEGFTPETRGLLEQGRSITASAYLRAQGTRRALLVAANALANRYDCLLLPSASGPAPDRATIGDGMLQLPATLFGIPSVTVPVGSTAEGLPLGAQLIAGRGREIELLQLAAWVEIAAGSRPRA